MLELQNEFILHSLLISQSTESIYEYINPYIYNCKWHTEKLSDDSYIRSRTSIHHYEYMISENTNKNELLNLLKSKCKYIAFDKQIQRIKRYFILYNINHFSNEHQVILKAIIEKNAWNDIFILTSTQFANTSNKLLSILVPKFIKDTSHKKTYEIDFVNTLINELNFDDIEACRDVIYKLITNNIEFKYIGIAIIQRLKDENDAKNPIHKVIRLVSQTDNRIRLGERSIYHIEYLFHCLNT